MKNSDSIARNIYYQLADIIEISAIYSHGERLYFRARPYIEYDKALDLIRQRLGSSGFEVRISEDMQGLLIGVKQVIRRNIPWLNIILFAATALTMFISQVMPFNNIFNLEMIAEAFSRTPLVNNGLEYMVALMSILVFHEFGHYLTGRRRGVFMSLPYFIPAPTPIGTFGAIIKSRSPITNRRDLIEVGATGPVAGFVISIIALTIGLGHSEVIVIEDPSGLIMGESLVLKFLTWLIVGPLPENASLILSPAAFAGWVGILVTMLNLLPLGQLDGGHIIYGLFGKAQHNIGRFFAVVMAVMGFWWPGWWFFGILVIFFGIKHPPTRDDATQPPLSAKILGFVAIGIFIISFIPVPLSLG